MKKNTFKSSNLHNGFTISDSNILKGIAIILLMIHHCFMSKDRYEGFQINFFPFKEWQLVSIARYGKICVAIFVFVSAYGLAISYINAQKKGNPYPSGITYRRLWKLLTAFWAAYIVVIIGCIIFSPGRLTYYSKEKFILLNIIFEMLGISYLLDTPMLIGTWWYFSLAIFTIFLVPVMLFVYQRIKGLGLIFWCVILSRFLGLQDYKYGNYNYLLVIALAICMAETNFFEKLQNFKKDYVLFRVLKILLVFILLIFSYYLFNLWYTTTNQDILMMYCSGLVAVLVSLLIKNIPGISQLLSFLGKHSMNIFAIHTFIRVVWFYDWLYSLKYWWLIAFILLFISVCISLILEKIKKITHYNQFVSYIEKKIINSFQL